MVPRDLNIGETRVWRLDFSGQIYNPGPFFLDFCMYVAEHSLLNIVGEFKIFKQLFLRGGFFSSYKPGDSSRDLFQETSWRSLNH